jgi:hypothetical protein
LLKIGREDENAWFNLGVGGQSGYGYKLFIVVHSGAGKFEACQHGTAMSL